MDASATESKTSKCIRAFVQGLPVLIGATAWIEWLLVPLLVEPEGGPFKYPRHCSQAVMLSIFSFVAIPIALMAYRTARTRLLGCALPASHLLINLIIPVTLASFRY